ncbi:hypothetical protein CISG_07305 [Coccidioides immitis RMSCC 3703]|uniref:Uncharacterized protein n=1 Tax=Coccidioides immitis RMSCC 3703 TaxID=454286 RepID=A0A0J8R5K7_COCIT|nr:hypothetical protein CISG_07305 [Coccidioides immitis RMSCC 3703]
MTWCECYEHQKTLCQQSRAKRTEDDDTEQWDQFIGIAKTEEKELPYEELIIDKLPDGYDFDKFDLVVHRDCAVASKYENQKSSQNGDKEYNEGKSNQECNQERNPESYQETGQDSDQEGGQWGGPWGEFQESNGQVSRPPMLVNETEAGNDDNCTHTEVHSRARKYDNLRGNSMQSKDQNDWMEPDKAESQVATEEL